MDRSSKTTIQFTVITTKGPLTWHSRYLILLFLFIMYSIIWPALVIYRYVFSEWRSIRPVEINQYHITMATHYDITMRNDIARDVHCKITMDINVAGNIHCDVTLSIDVGMCTYHGITMLMTLLWTSSIIYSLLYAKLCYFIMGSME